MLPKLFLLVGCQTQDYRLPVGLFFGGFDTKVQKGITQIATLILRFKAFQGVEPTTVAPIFEDLKKEYPYTIYKDALIRMHWFYPYDTYPILDGKRKCYKVIIDQKVLDYRLKIGAVVMKKVIFKLKE